MLLISLLLLGYILALYPWYSLPLLVESQFTSCVEFSPLNAYGDFRKITQGSYDAGVEICYHVPLSNYIAKIETINSYQLNTADTLQAYQGNESYPIGSIKQVAVNTNNTLSNDLFIELNADASILTSRAGFTVFVSALPPPCSDIVGELQFIGDKLNFTQGIFPSGYSRCWKIRLNGHTVDISFSDISFAPSNNRIAVYDGINENAPLIADLNYFTLLETKYVNKDFLLSDIPKITSTNSEYLFVKFFGREGTNAIPSATGFLGTVIALSESSCVDNQFTLTSEGDFYKIKSRARSDSVYTRCWSFNVNNKKVEISFKTFELMDGDKIEIFNAAGNAALSNPIDTFTKLSTDLKKSYQGYNNLVVKFTTELSSNGQFDGQIVIVPPGCDTYSTTFTDVSQFVTLKQYHFGGSYKRCWKINPNGYKIGISASDYKARTLADHIEISQNNTVLLDFVLNNNLNINLQLTDISSEIIITLSSEESDTTRDGFELYLESKPPPCGILTASLINIGDQYNITQGAYSAKYERCWLINLNGHAAELSFSRFKINPILQPLSVYDGTSKLARRLVDYGTPNLFPKKVDVFNYLTSLPSPTLLGSSGYALVYFYSDQASSYSGVEPPAFEATLTIVDQSSCTSNLYSLSYAGDVVPIASSLTRSSGSYKRCWRIKTKGMRIQFQFSLVDLSFGDKIVLYNQATGNFNSPDFVINSASNLDNKDEYKSFFEVAATGNINDEIIVEFRTTTSSSNFDGRVVALVEEGCLNYDITLTDVGQIFKLTQDGYESGYERCFRIRPNGFGTKITLQDIYLFEQTSTVNIYRYNTSYLLGSLTSSSSTITIGEAVDDIIINIQATKLGHVQAAKAAFLVESIPAPCGTINAVFTDINSVYSSFQGAFSDSYTRCWKVGLRGFYAKLSFTKFNIYDYANTFEVFDGPDDTYPKLGSFGIGQYSSSGLLPANITSTSTDFILIKFKAIVSSQISGEDGLNFTVSALSPTDCNQYPIDLSTSGAVKQIRQVGYYTANPRCTKVIFGNNFGLISFSSFNTGDGDTLYVYNSFNEDETYLIGKFDGNTIPAQMYVTNKKLLFKFVPSNNDSNKGFTFTITSKKNIPTATCSQGVTGYLTKLGSIAGVYLSNYRPNQVECYLFSLFGESAILEFTSFRTEKDADILYVYDGKDENAPLLAQFSGNTLPGLTITVSQKQYIFLKFTSNGNSITSSGFVGSVRTTISHSCVDDFANLATIENLNCLVSGSSELQIPNNIGNFSDLKSISLYGSSLIGTLPPTIGNLYKLTSLSVQNTGIRGTIPGSLANLNGLKSLVLDRNDFTGTIPTIASALRNLKYLAISNNGRLNGTDIKEVIPLDAPLEKIEVQNSNLIGELPQQMQKLSATLIRLDISGNLLNGTLVQVSNLTNLALFNAQNNQFNGEIPSALFLFPSLSLISLQKNQFTKIPISLQQAVAKEIRLGGDSYLCNCELTSWFGTWAATTGKLYDWSEVKCGPNNKYHGSVVASIRTDPDAPCFAPKSLYKISTSESSIIFGWEYDVDDEPSNLTHHFEVDAISSTGDKLTFSVPWNNETELTGTYEFQLVGLTPFTTYSLTVHPVFRWYDKLVEYLSLDHNPISDVEPLIDFNGEPQTVSTVFSTSLLTPEQVQEIIDDIRNVRGPGSLSIDIKTDPYIPSEPPEFVCLPGRVDMEIIWKVPKNINSDADDVWYTVNIVGPSTSRSHVTDAGRTSYLVTNATSATNFAISMQTHNRFGSSSVSPPKICKTLDPCALGTIYNPITEDCDECPFDTYGGTLSPTGTCQSCPPDFSETLVRGAKTIADCTTPAGSLNLGDKKITCPDGAVCDAVNTTVETMKISNSYWRSSPQQVEVLKCVHESYCVGSGNPNNRKGGRRALSDFDSLPGDVYCAPDHIGVMCEACSGGKKILQAAKGCEECKIEEISLEKSSLTLVIIGIPLGISLVLIVAAFLLVKNDKKGKFNRFKRSNLQEQDVTIGVETSELVHQSPRHKLNKLRHFSKTAVIKAVLKSIGMVFSTLQIVGLIVVQFRGRYSKSTFEKTHPLQFFALSFDFVLRTPCLFPSLNPLYINIVFNLVGVSCLYIFLYICEWIVKKVLGPILGLCERGGSGSGSELSNAWKDDFYSKTDYLWARTRLMMLGYFYPGLLATLLRPFQCATYGGVRAVVSDLSILCENNPTLNTWKIISGIFAIFIGIGVPLFFFAILRKWRAYLLTFKHGKKTAATPILNEEQTHEFHKVEGLFGDYKQARYYLAPWIALYKVFITSILPTFLIFVGVTIPHQLIALLFFLFLWLAYLIMTHPYRNQTKNITAATGQFILCFVTFSGILYGSDVVPTEPQKQMLGDITYAVVVTLASFMGTFPIYMAIFNPEPSSSDGDDFGFAEDNNDGRRRNSKEPNLVAE